MDSDNFLHIKDVIVIKVIKDITSIAALSQLSTGKKFIGKKIWLAFLLFMKYLQSDDSVYEFVHTWYGSVNRFCDHCVALYYLPTNDRRCSGNYMKFTV